MKAVESINPAALSECLTLPCCMASMVLQTSRQHGSRSLEHEAAIGMKQKSDLAPSDRRAALVAAEERAETLFDEIERRELVRPGRTERDVEQDIYALALEQFGVEKHWHKRIVRAGANTLTIAADNPPVLDIGDNDIVYVDLGPVFEDWEADLGRTYILGDHSGAKLVEDCRLFSIGCSRITARRRT
jgi:Metallopeptidase family M24